MIGCTHDIDIVQTKKIDNATLLTEQEQWNRSTHHVSGVMLTSTDDSLRGAMDGDSLTAAMIQ